MTESPSTDRPRVAVVVNPTKVSDTFHSLLVERLAAAGWAEPLWLETSEEDPGRGMTQEALAAGVDLVIGAGGDGTGGIGAGGLAGGPRPRGGGGAGAPHTPRPHPPPAAPAAGG